MPLPERLRASLFALLTLVAGCSPAVVAPADGDATPASDASDDSDVTPALDAGGVCCPIEISPPTCSPGSLRVGGWAPSLDQCIGGGFDGAPYAIRTVDSHGCPVIAGDPCMRPCGFVPDASFTPPAHCTASDAGVTDP